MDFGLNPLMGLTGSPTLNLDQPKSGPLSMSTDLQIYDVNWENPPTAEEQTGRVKEALSLRQHFRDNPSDN